MLATLLSSTGLLLLHAARARAEGLTLDLCNSTTACVPTRNCYDSSSTSLTPCPTDVVSVCVCAPDIPQYCMRPRDCDVGELCARTITSPSSCMSALAVSVNEVLFSITEAPPAVPIPSGNPPPIWQNVGDRPRGESCNKPLDCSSGLFCLSFASADSSRCNGEADTCRCVPRGSGKKCESTADCGKFVCASVSNADPICLPQDVIDDTEDALPVNPPTTTPIVTPAPSKASPDPSNVAPDPSNVAPDPSKPAPDPSNVAPDPSKPAPDPSQAAPAPSKPAPVPSKPAPAPSKPAPAPSKPAPASSKPAPASSKATPAPPVTAPVPSSQPVNSPAASPLASVDPSTPGPLPSVTARGTLPSQAASSPAVTALPSVTVVVVGPTPPVLVTSTAPSPSLSSTVPIADTASPNGTDEPLEASIDPSVSPLPTPSSATSIASGGLPGESTAAESPEEEICISVEHLSDVPHEQLVYREHRYARVMCDQQYSCATPGHIVVHNADAMMMSTYCEKEGVTCRETVMLVNSVKYSKKVRLASRTSGLEFTALAARFSTKVEERVLTAAVRFGL